MLKFSLKFFKYSFFPNLITDLIHLWYDDTYWSKILHSTIPTNLGQGQDHRLRIFMLKFYVEVFRLGMLRCKHSFYSKLTDSCFLLLFNSPFYCIKSVIGFQPLILCNRRVISRTAHDRHSVVRFQKSLTITSHQ